MDIGHVIDCKLNRSLIICNLLAMIFTFIRLLKWPLKVSIKVFCSWNENSEIAESAANRSFQYCIPFRFIFANRQLSYQDAVAVSRQQKKDPPAFHSKQTQGQTDAPQANQTETIEPPMRIRGTNTLTATIRFLAHRSHNATANVPQSHCDGRAIAAYGSVRPSHADVLVFAVWLRGEAAAYGWALHRCRSLLRFCEWP